MTPIDPQRHVLIAGGTGADSNHKPVDTGPPVDPPRIAPLPFGPLPSPP